MLRLFTVAFVVFASTVSAQMLPERYKIEGVASDDVLNIRARPDANSAKIGELGPDTLNVEILRTLEGWGQVPTSEGMGWVSLQFLTLNPWPTKEAPRPLVCSGTEPFWTQALFPRGPEYNALAVDTSTTDEQTVIYEKAAPNGFLIRLQDGEGPGAIRTLMVDGRACSDGMSDRPYGMSATLFNETPDGNFMQTGCCTMQVN